ncbi:MAG: RidA family protein [Bacteroidota bacterium]
MKTQRRSVLRKLFAAIIGVTGVNGLASAKTISGEQQHSDEMINFQNAPLYPGWTKMGNLVFISGTGADAASVHDIKKDTDFVLKKMEKRLIDAGSSMNKVLKVTVFLQNMDDFEGMNEVYKGRFGSKPPVRSTVAVAKGGIPGNSILEIDCIAYI